MNERQAEQAGYSFTGIYERSLPEVHTKRDALKVKGYKAVIVTEPDNPLSRGSHGTGYSVYAEKKYFDDREKCDLQKRWDGIDGRREYAKKEYEKTLYEINEDALRIYNRLAELNKET